jgi:hypothetical protein
MTSLLGALASAGATMTVQVAALISLASADFGLFSLIYLLGALLLSLALSTVCEAWTRTASNTGRLDDWTAYGGVTVFLSAIGAVAAGAVAFAVPAMSGWWWTAAIAVYASTYRLSARYYNVRVREWRGVLPADLAGFAVAVAGGVWAFSAFRGELGAIFVVWAASAAAAGLLSKPAPLPRRSTLRGWVTTHRGSVAPLLRDSLIMDATAIGTPYALAPLLGLADFGVYRAVSNVAAPVRLLLNPLRPWFSTQPLIALRSTRFLVANLAAALGIGAAATLAIWLIRVWHLQLGTLSALTPFAAAVGLFVASNYVSHVFYIGARHHVTPRLMLAGRVIQTVVSIGGPIAAAMIAGLPGAIWAYAIATSISAAGWIFVVRRSVTGDSDGRRPT